MEKCQYTNIENYIVGSMLFQIILPTAPTLQLQAKTGMLLCYLNYFHVCKIIDGVFIHISESDNHYAFLPPKIDIFIFFKENYFENSYKFNLAENRGGKRIAFILSKTCLHCTTCFTNKN